MGRYTGPSCRLCRHAEVKLYLKGDRCYGPKCPIGRRTRPPGVGDRRVRRRRPSDYAVRQLEKQKLRNAYGLYEKQFVGYVSEARKQPGVTGQYLLQLLERRLDNVVYRLNLSDSRKQARQRVLHGHFTVNGRKVNIPSYSVRAGDMIAWKTGSSTKDFVLSVAEGISQRLIPEWLRLDSNAMIGHVVSLPELDEADLQVDTRLIVEYYSG